jgi:hypothetical protein
MSERQIDVDLSSGTETRIDQVPSPEELKEYKAKIAQVLDRSLTVDRLRVDIPGHLKSFWCSNDPLSIAQAELRGFKVDTEFALRNGLSSSEDGKARIADVIHMVRPKWMEDEERKVIAQRYVENHLTDRKLNKTQQKEEREFVAANELPSIVNSKAENVSGDVIEESLKK